MALCQFSERTAAHSDDRDFVQSSDWLLEAQGQKAEHPEFSSIAL